MLMPVGIEQPIEDMDRHSSGSSTSIQGKSINRNELNLYAVSMTKQFLNDAFSIFQIDSLKIE